MSNMKSLQLKAAVALLLAALVVTGCYNPSSDPVGGYPAAHTGAAQPASALAPVNAPPVTPPPLSGTPLLRISDMVTIEFFDTPNPLPPYKERIRDDGKLILPLNVTVQAAGRTVAQLQDDIRKEYVGKYYNHLTVSVKTDERVYFVGGEVKVPNRQFYQDGITVLRAIDTAGGFTDFANRGKIELRRQNGEIVKVDWKRAMRNPKLDPPVYPNDQVMVHKRTW